ncbi:MAG: hypothetical protein WAW88_13495 [Nocardioides sp.]
MSPPVPDETGVASGPTPAGGTSPAGPTTCTITFCGEEYAVAPAGLSLGREADVVLDSDNRHLHRRFLLVTEEAGSVWLHNVGSLITVAMSDAAGRMTSQLAPGARAGVPPGETTVWFTAGPTVYEFTITVPTGAAAEHAAPLLPTATGDTTVGRVSLTPAQKLLVLALAEQVLRGQGRGIGAIPPSRAAAQRLGWTQTRFNRKLDNVCDKLTKVGVRGLIGIPGQAASTRRARLVDYAVSTRMVSPEDLPLLDLAATGSEHLL